MARYDSFSEAISFHLVGLSAIACKECSYIFETVLQSIEECVDIKEKVKKYIVKRNAREGVAGSGSGDADAPSTPLPRSWPNRALALLAKMLLKMG
jgi:hypothetical protein